MLATGLMRLRDSEWTETCSHSIEVLLLLLCLQVNTGRMNFPREKWDLIIGNLALKQVQATVLGFLAVLAASPLGWAHDEKLVTVIVNYAALLCCSSVVTAFTASLLQSIIMVGVIIVSKRAGINLDNIAIPIAASFGDLITPGSSTLLPSPCIVYMVRVLFLCLTPVWVIISLRHPESRRLLYCSCKPIITAMVTSSLGGLILDRAMTDPNLMGVVLYIPIINGPNSRTAQMLLLLAVPGHVFLYIIYLMQGGHTSPKATFITLYLVAAFTQVFLLLGMADWMVHCLWRYGRDPDSFAIPYLTALRNLLGTALLALFLPISGYH